MSISVEVLIGVATLVGLIAGGVIWISRTGKDQAKEAIVGHNSDESAHKGLRTAIEKLDTKVEDGLRSIHQRIDEHLRNDEEWKQDHVKDMERAKDEILKAIRNGHDG